MCTKVPEDILIDLGPKVKYPVSENNLPGQNDLVESDEIGTKIVPDIAYPSLNNYFLRPFHYCPVINYYFSFIYKMK